MTLHLTVHIDQQEVSGPYRWYVCDQFRHVFARSRRTYKQPGMARRAFRAWLRRLQKAEVRTHTAIQLPLFGTFGS